MDVCAHVLVTQLLAVLNPHPKQQYAFLNELWKLKVRSRVAGWLWVRSHIALCACRFGPQEAANEPEENGLLEKLVELMCQVGWQYACFGGEGRGGGAGEEALFALHTTGRAPTPCTDMEGVCSSSPRGCIPS